MREVPGCLELGVRELAAYVTVERRPWVFARDHLYSNVAWDASVTEGLSVLEAEHHLVGLHVVAPALESFTLYTVHLDILGEFHINHGAERAQGLSTGTRGSFWHGAV